ncbi:PAS domain-containing sensor histidine kinase [Phosphitispora sp. TUW77]|uniref:PAS domain-containing sensor histidine kinase n=1 Tax=Phosphitispora sp. TUW77 TaxID=3152361 RepID=UPI003AB5BA52
MIVINYAIIAMVSTTFMLSLVYLYISQQKRERYIAFWGLSWAIYSLSFLFDIFYHPANDRAWLILEKQILYFVSILLLMWGTYLFLNKKLAKSLVYLVIIIIIFLIILPLFKISYSTLTLPSSLLLSLLPVWTGIEFLNSLKEEGIIHHFTGWMFIVWGIHKGYYFFVRPEFWFSPWGYLSSSILTPLLSICILLVYFEKTTQELIKHENRFRLLAEHAQDMLYRCRLLPEPAFEYVSPAALTVTGYKPEEFYQNPQLFFDSLNKSDKKHFFSTIEKAATDPEANVKFRLQRKNGEIIWVEQSHTFISDQLGNLLAIEGIVRDISEHKRVEEEFMRLEKFRRDLLSTVSHELRTPITTIQGYAETVLHCAVNEPGQIMKYLQIIYAKTQGLNRLISDIMQLTQLEARQLTLNISHIPVQKMLKQIYHKYEIDVRNAELNFTLNWPPLRNEGLTREINPNREICIAIDPDRIDQIFGNLIFNSIKQTLPGGTLEVGCHSTTKAEVVCFVRDNGSGISAKELPHIFDRFFKGKPYRTGYPAGSGLGLAITKQLVEAHGGRIWVESEVGTGTVFFISLPRVL